MATVNIRRIAHFRESNSDKIWGYAHVGDNIFSFWGKRGGSLSFQAIDGSTTSQAEAKAETKFRTKTAKGYRNVAVEDANRLIWGDVTEYVTSNLISALQRNTVTHAIWAKK